MRKERKRGRERARERGERRKKCLYTSVKLFISVYLCVSTSTDSVNYRFEKKKKQTRYIRDENERYEQEIRRSNIER